MRYLRPLGDTIADLADGVIVQMMPDEAYPPVRVTSLNISIPIDISIAPDDEAFLGDLPLFRRRTAFDPEPSHLTITLAEAPS